MKKVMLIGPHDFVERLRINVKEEFDLDKFYNELLTHPHYRFVPVSDKPSEPETKAPEEKKPEEKTSGSSKKKKKKKK